MPPPVSSLQLAQLRRIDESTMVSTADIINHTRVSNGAGGSVVSEVTQSDVPCRRQARKTGEGEIQFGGQQYPGLQWNFAFPAETDIGTDSVIVSEGERFAVLSVLGPRTLETARRVIAARK